MKILISIFLMVALLPPFGAIQDCVHFGDYHHWVGEQNTPDEAKGLAIYGTYAFVADDGSGLQVIDITNPESPQLVGRFSTPTKCLWNPSLTLWFFRNAHVHIPEGAIPKDGPSAGIAMATAMVSLLREIPVRTDVAMTGEVTLRGKVLPIGGLPEKAVAAIRAGSKHLIIPRDNERDFLELAPEIRDHLTVHLVEEMDQVLEVALVLPEKSKRAKATGIKKSRKRKS